MTEKKKIHVVVPAYQAALTLKKVFDRLPAELDEKDITYVIINDGSADETGRVAEELAAERGHVEVIHHETNKGYAQAQKTGYRHALEAGADMTAMLHADGQYAPEVLPELLEPLEQDEADVVSGSRMLNPRDALKGNMPFYKWIANRALTTIENWAYGLHLSEYHTGYMLYSRKALTTIPFMKLSDTFHFDGEMLMMAGKYGLRIKELSIPTCYAEEKSHLKPISYGFDVLSIIVKYRLGKYDFDNDSSNEEEAHAS